MMRSIRVILFVGLMTLTMTPVANAQGLCGDCDQNGIINVLDSLTAAQISVGLVTPTPSQRIDCDVDGSNTVDVLDALLISQFAAGLPTTLACPGAPVINPTAVGYCVIGNLNSNQPWEIAVADVDFFTGASFTSPPLMVPEIQLVPVNSPWPAAGTATTAAAMVGAINSSTQIFADVVNPGMASFGAATTLTHPSGLFTCFAPFVATTAPVPIHFASIGIVNPNGTICFPPLGGACSFNPDVLLSDGKDADGDGLPDDANAHFDDSQENQDGTTEDETNADENGEDVSP